MLRETAARYGATITYSEFADAIQARSGVHTDAAQRTWLAPVLRLVATACHGRGLPPLISLAVNTRDGKVSPVYDVVRQIAGQEPFASKSERERHAAQSRLACYQEYCLEIPKDPKPTLASDVAPTPSLAPRTQQIEQRAQVCERCFIELPLMGGGCPNCD